MTRLRSPRRLALALVMLAASGAALTAATAGMATINAAHTVQVAAARDGDAWSYAVYTVAANGSVEEATTRQFERLGTGTMLDGNQSVRGGAVVREYVVDRTPCGTDQVMERDVVVAPAGRVVGTTDRFIPGGGCAQLRITGDVTAQREMERFHVQTMSSPAVDLLPCGHWHSGQGKPIDAREGLVLAGDCPHSLPFAGRLDTDNGPVWSFADNGTEVWLAAEHPVPVRVSQRVGNETILMQLTAHQAGRAPVSFAPDGAPGQPLAVAATTTGIPDTAGAELDFALADAIALARDDAAFDRLLGAGYVQAAAFSHVRHENADGAEDHARWALTATDGRTARSLRVTQVTPAAISGMETDLFARPCPSNEPADVMQRGWCQYTTVTEQRAPEGPFPAAPAPLPRLSDVAIAWGGTATAWGFSHGCAATCAQAAANVWAGDYKGYRYVAPVIVTGVIQTDWTTDTMTFDHEGRLVRSQSMEPVERGGTEVSFEPAPAQAEAGATLHEAPSGAVPIAVGVGGLAGLIVAVWQLAKALPFFGLRSEQNAVRRSILSVVAAEPGIHHQELMRRVGHGNNVVTHHVRRLAKADLLVQQAGSRYTCYFPKGKVDRRVMAVAPILKSGRARDVLAAVAKAPGGSGQEVAAALGVAPGTISFHAKRLLDAGLLEARRDGKSVRYGCTDLGRMALKSQVAA